MGKSHVAAFNRREKMKRFDSADWMMSKQTAGGETGKNSLLMRAQQGKLATPQVSAPAAEVVGATVEEGAACNQTESTPANEGEAAVQEQEAALQAKYGGAMGKSHVAAFNRRE